MTVYLRGWDGGRFLQCNWYWIVIALGPLHFVPPHQPSCCYGVITVHTSCIFSPAQKPRRNSNASKWVINGLEVHCVGKWLLICQSLPRPPVRSNQLEELISFRSFPFHHRVIARCLSSVLPYWDFFRCLLCRSLQQSGSSTENFCLHGVEAKSCPRQKQCFLLIKLFPPSTCENFKKEKYSSLEHTKELVTKWFRDTSC